jgi:DHA1 family inner membrane transport protein
VLQVGNSSRTSWNLVGLLVAAGVVAAFHVGKVPPAIPSIQADFNASLAQAGWLLSMVTLTAAMGGMAIALTVDRFGHRRLILLGTALGFGASLFGAFASSFGTLLVWRFLEGLGFIVVTTSVPALLIRIAQPADQRRVMTLWSCYMPAGAGSMMLLSAGLLPGQSWRTTWLVAAGASALMLAALALRALPRHELDALPTKRRPVLQEMDEVATSGGPIAIAVCFGAYSSYWYAVIGFLPSLQVDRLGFSTATAAVVTALVTMANVGGNLLGGRLLRHLPRVSVIAGAALLTAVCAAGVFVDGVPDLLRLMLAGIYSLGIGAVPAALFTALPVHAPRPELVGASTGLLMQGSNIGGLLGPPITGGLVAAGGWSAAAWSTSAALGIVAVSGAFLHWRERRKLSP